MIIFSIGTALISNIMIKSSMIRISMASQLTEEPQINLSSKIDFASQTAICMQLSQPSTQLNQVIEKSIQIPAEKKPNVFKRQTKLRYKLPGYTHVLNRKNTEMCNRILK